MILQQLILEQIYQIILLQILPASLAPKAPPGTSAPTNIIAVSRRHPPPQPTPSAPLLSINALPAYSLTRETQVLTTFGPVSEAMVVPQHPAPFLYPSSPTPPLPLSPSFLQPITKQSPVPLSLSPPLLLTPLSLVRQSPA